MLPLTLKSMKSMKAMQALQPELQELKEKFGDTPEDRQEFGIGLCQLSLAFDGKVAKDA